MARRQRIFCRGKEDEKCQVFCNRVKPVLNAGIHKDERPCFNCATLCAYLDEATTTDDIVNFIFGMRLLWIDRTR